MSAAPLLAAVCIDRPLGRLPYLLWGVGLFVLKFVLDWVISEALFGVPWSPASYFVAPTRSLLAAALNSETPWLYTCLLLVALPFLTAGLVLTGRRLRDAGLPLVLVGLFFLPFVNLLLFALLCLLPGKPVEPTVIDAEPVFDTPPSPDPRLREAVRRERDSPRWRRLRQAHRHVTYENESLEALIALAVSVPLTVGAIALGANLLANYGWGLFVGAPFALGMGSVLIYGANRPKSSAARFGLAMTATTLTGLALLVLAFEGAICLFMAAPIFYAVAGLGATLGCAIQARPWAAGDYPALLLALVIALPGLMAAESLAAPPPDLHEVTSAVEIDAPPAVVWRLVVAFPPLPEPDEWLFRAGVAYPLRAEIHGTGVGAVRRCVFSTGAFVEPVEVWDEPRRLAFRVSEQPAPMREWSPFDVHPPHLDHYLVSERGEFRLVPLPDGRTRLEGTTWYTNRMWPAAYWRLWSDELIHRIHLRVLRHIGTFAEQESPG